MLCFVLRNSVLLNLLCLWILFQNASILVSGLFKGLAHADWAERKKKTNIYLFILNNCFRYDFSVAIISALALLKYATNYGGLKIGALQCVLCHYILLFHAHFCRLGLQTTGHLPQSHNLDLGFALWAETHCLYSQLSVKMVSWCCTQGICN